MCYIALVTGKEQSKLSPAVRPCRRSNRWWFKLAAASFTIKVVLVVGLFLALTWAASSTGDDNDTKGSSSGAEIRAVDKAPK